MKMKLLSSAILAAGLLSATAAVQAATIEFFGTLSNGVDVSIFSQGTFMVDSAIDNSGVTLTTDSFKAGNFNPFLAVWNSQGYLVGYGDDIYYGPPGVDDYDARIEFAPGALDNGTYYFTVSNAPYMPSCIAAFDAGGTCNISQSYVMNGPVIDPNALRPGTAFSNGAEWHVTVTGVVPEPETWAMLLAGLGMVGAVARRRRL